MLGFMSTIVTRCGMCWDMCGVQQQQNYVHTYIFLIYMFSDAVDNPGITFIWIPK